MPPSGAEVVASPGAERGEGREETDGKDETGRRREEEGKGGRGRPRQKDTNRGKEMGRKKGTRTQHAPQAAEDVLPTRNGQRERNYPGNERRRREGRRGRGL